MTLQLLLAGAFLSTLGFSQTAAVIPYRAIMLTTNEVPATNVEARGLAEIRAHVVRDAAGQITSGSVDFNVRYTFPPAQNFTGLHIHRGNAGANGPVVIDTGITAANSVIDEAGSGVISRQVQISSANATALQALRDLVENPSGFYVNLHTSQFPGGAIRGQLDATLMTVHMARMSPANEIPAITGSNAFGTAAISVFRGFNGEGRATSGMVMFEVDYDLTQQYTLTGLHVHRGFANENGPVVVDTGITAANPVLTAENGRGVATYMVELPATAAGEELAGGITYVPAGFYVNMHTTINPGGFIRGQLRPTELRHFDVRMSTANEVPPVNLDASATAAVDIYSIRNAAGAVEAASVSYSVNYRFPGAIEIVGLHIHDGEAGMNGPVRLDSGITGAAAIASETGVGNITRRLRADTEAELATVNSLLANPSLHYLNLHTRVNPGGAIRAQVGN